jgi:predicted transposase/invertase (TIGR01784 family)
MARPVFYSPTADPIFKYLMSDDEIRNAFLGSIINEKILESTPLDVALTPIPSYNALRDMLNRDDVVKAMQKFEKMDLEAVRRYQFTNEIRDTLMEFIKFMQELTPKYYDLINALPSLERNTQLDVVCETATGFVNIEMQVLPQDYWDLRILHHVCGLFNRQFSRGFRWTDLGSDVAVSKKIKRAIGVSILEDVSYNLNYLSNSIPWYNITPWKNDEMLRSYRLSESDNPRNIRPGLEFYDVNLSAFKVLKDRHGFGSCRKDVLEWIEFFATANSKLSKPTETSGAVSKAYDKISHIPDVVEEEYGEYLIRKENLTQYAAEVRQEGIEEGRKEGLEEGRKEGMEEGRKEGLEEGRKEGLEEGLQKGRQEGQYDLIRTIHANGTPVEQIASMLNMTLEQVTSVLRTNC